MQRLGAALRFASPIPEGILGPEVRDLARSKGVGMLFPTEGRWSGGRPKMGPVVDPLLSRLRRHGLMPQVGTHSGDFSNDVGVMLSPTGTPNIPNLGKREWTSVTPAIGDDKLREAELFKGFIPKSVDLHDVLEHNYTYEPNDLKHLSALRKTLSKKFKRGWIVKDKGGFGSAAGSMLTDQTPVEGLKGRLTRFGGQMVQERRPIAELPAWQRKLDARLGDLVGTSQNLQRGTQEYRVHAMDGKVVPYATLHRGSPTQAILERWMPWRSQRIREAEAHVQKALDAARKRDPNSIDGTFHGFDVGLGPEGKPFIIEANPSSMGAGSGMLEDPQVQDAIGAAVRGRLPTYVAARRGLWAGGAGLGGYAALKPEEDTRPTWQQWLGKQSSRNWLTAFPEYAQLSRQIAQSFRPPRLPLELPPGGGA